MERSGSSRPLASGSGLFSSAAPGILLQINPGRIKRSRLFHELQEIQEVLEEVRNDLSPVLGITPSSIFRGQKRFFDLCNCNSQGSKKIRLCPKR